MRIFFTTLRWLSFLVALLLAAAMLFAGERWMRIEGSLPPLSGEAAADAVKGRVTIVRDKNAVAHISGETEADVYFGLGFVHAQERLWQMAFYRRLLQGRLSEVVGASALKTDQLARALDLAGRARASLDHLSPRAHDVLAAYAQGVNAWAEARTTKLPPEFTILMTKFEPWRPQDSLLMLKFLGMGLSGNAVDEVRRARLIKLIGPARAAELYPPYSNALPVTIRDALVRDHAANFEADPLLDLLSQLQGASNNWVVDGRFTKSGKPMLANDPHLSLTAPGVWYLAHLKLPNGDVAGGTIPGIPSIVLGHNGHIAWGFTTTHADTEDLVFETIDPKSPERYLTPQGSVPFSVRQETIKVRFGRPFRATFRETRHGPVLPPVFKSIDEIAPEGTVAALAAAGLARDDTTFDSGLLLMDAKTPEDLAKAALLLQAPMQNIVWASIDGHIGFMAPARVPMRSKTAVQDGLTPADGKLQNPLWTGYVPYAELPQTVDPPAGKIWTANNKIVPDAYPHLIAGEWPSGWRAERIGELLGKGAPWGPEDFTCMQMDDLSPDARVLLPRLLAAPAAGAREAEALKRMAAWDYEMRAAASEPLIYVVWIAELQRLLIADDLGKLAREIRAPREEFLIAALTQGAHSDWCDDGATPDKETCDAMIARALAAALARIAREQGGDLAKWRWDRAHPALHAHGVFGRIPFLAKWFNRETPFAGGANTLNRADMPFTGKRPLASVHGSGLRTVFDLADLAHARFMIALGQSGNPLSPYYDNFMAPSARGETIEIPIDAALYGQGAIGTWTIAPAH